MDSFEQQQQDLDPHRKKERDAAAVELAGRIRQKGIQVSGQESSAQLDDLLTAIDRFEAAVTARGGDPMINTPTSNPPENPDFVVPRRDEGENIDTYSSRVHLASARLENADL